MLALDAMARKRFHCEGGAVIAGGDPRLTRIVALYQTLCDYLDTLTDRGPSVPSGAIAQLHLAAVDALDPEAPGREYFRSYPLDDGGFLEWLSAECRALVGELPSRRRVEEPIRWLARRYGELQSLKHAPDRRRRSEMLRRWRRLHGAGGVAWWEFSAACGSTLGIFALLALAKRPEVDDATVQDTFESYFPWIGGLHILLDYLVDEEEDRVGGDFNFVRCYPDRPSAIEGISRLYRTAHAAAGKLRMGDHRWIVEGLPAFYLADRKAELLPPAEVRSLLALGGVRSSILHWLARHGRTR